VASKQSREIRRFSTVAGQRFEEAEILFRNQRTTGAIYLAGYAVECMLKALLLANTPVKNHSEMLKAFRGQMGHNLDWLKGKLPRKKLTIPDDILRAFTKVNTWSTDLRYTAGRKPEREARAFLDATLTMMNWIKGRL
jgi:HEPN domain-containing protein